MASENTFRLGICMAGAVSAGAYTAGVMDYLLEALEHWERAKLLQEEGKLSNVPKHKVLIEVLSGASAGGMTAAITSAAIQNDFPAMNKDTRSRPDAADKNPLFNAWVNLTEKDGTDMMDKMLDPEDIIHCNEVRAGLNSSFISEIAENILTKTVKSGGKDRPYIAPDLDIFATLTNLRGFNYQIKFKTTQGVREHRMRMHRDVAFFQLSDDADYRKNGRIPLSFVGEGQNKKVLAQAAMATGAFPVGLESRELLRSRAYINDNKYLNLHLANSECENVQYDFLPEGDFESLSVDGGVINNEPFEITQQLLEDRRRDEMSRELKNRGVDEKERKSIADAYQPKVAASHFDTTVIMVDPFPNDEETPPASYSVLKAWKFALPKILAAMRGQLMMKDREVTKAYLSDDYSRFLISPVRTVNDQKQTYSIACGSFGGFGGFFSKKFREHDFYLGRRNCQRFLQRYFTVPVASENPILKSGYEGFQSEFIYEDTCDGKVVQYLPIIPDRRVVYDAGSGKYTFAAAEAEEEFPYPNISVNYLLGLEKKFEKRIKCILSNVANGIDPESVNKPPNEIIARIRKKSPFQKVWQRIVLTPLTKLYLNIGKYAVKGTLAKKIIDIIITDMYERGLLKEGKPPVSR